MCYIIQLCSNVGNNKEIAFRAIADNIIINIIASYHSYETWPMELMCITTSWVVEQFNDLTYVKNQSVL